jgi:hypothetical protein
MTRYVCRLVVAALIWLCAPPTWAAIAIDVNTSTDRATAATTVTSPAFSTAAVNELLLAFVAADGLSTASTSVTGVTGAGLTWGLVVRANGQAGTAEVWRAFAPARLTGVTVTATVSRSVVSSITVLSFTGVETTGTNGSGAIGATASRSASTGAPTASLVTTRGESWVFGVGVDWDNPIARTLGAGQSMVHQKLSSVGDTYWVQKQNAPTPAAGTTVTINDTAPTTDRYNFAICEVVSATVVAPPTLTVALTAPAAGNVSAVTTVSAIASDTASTVAGVQFQLDGVNLAAEATAEPYTIEWDTTTVGDGPHTLGAIVRSAAGGFASALPVVVNATNGFAVSGQWGQPFELGLVAVNAVLLHTGKVLLFSGSYIDSWTERVWDPATGSQTLVPNPYYNLFCAGQAQLPDGRILVAGGFDPPSLGAADANIFDPVTQSWSLLPNMSYRRWYPSVTTLGDGRMLVTSGGQTCLTCLAELPEVFDPATGRFTVMTAARLAMPYYPFTFLLPDGTVINAGATEQAVVTSKLNVSTSTWSTVDAVVRDGHSAAMYLPGKIIKTGSAADSGTPGNAAATAYVLDMTQPSPAWRQVASMASPRAFQNMTLLPDGNVLVNGGGTALNGLDTTKSVYASELWSPVTETWRTLASESIPRLYHSTSLLLPDGRVLSAGSGDDNGAVNQTRGQIYSPPYLFKGPRPTIAGVADTLQYGASFAVQTPDAATIASVSLMRPGSVTHGFDEDQRFIPLAFTAQSVLTIEAPGNGNLAPPGYYMLFLVNGNGVPSVASFVRFASPTLDTTPPTSPDGLTVQGAIGSATLTWTASTDSSGVALYNAHRSASPGFAPSPANRIGQPTSLSFTDSGAAPGTYFYLVTAQDVAQNVSAPSNEAMAIVLADTSAPIVTISTPADQAMVSNTVSIAATASDDVGVAGVQFQIDGAPLGVERVAPPYSMSWNTKTTANGAHSVSAIARDTAGNRTTATVNVDVSNTYSPPSGLVAAYGFSEGSGVQTLDASGQANTGTLSGATWNVAGKFGGALSFNGTSAMLTIADANSLDLTTGMTIEAWVNPTAGTAWRTVVLKENLGSLAYSLYSANNASRPAGFVHMTSDVGATGTAAAPINAWTHLAMTYDGAALRLYFNGALVRTTAVTGAMATGTGALRIGGNVVWGEYFKGMIDEVRVYNRALSAAEIQTDMTTPIP